jgi:chemotaxis protein CheD
VTPPGGDELALAPLEVFLSPGTLHCAVAPSRVTTILGSCVAVCLWDNRERLGGMNHFVLPHRRGDDASSLRFGDVAILTLVEQMLRLGCRVASLRAKLFGGAAVLPFAAGGDPVGAQNVRLAVEKLRDHGIPVIARHTGGTSGLLIRLFTESGDVMVRRVAAGASVPVGPREAASITRCAGDGRGERFGRVA